VFDLTNRESFFHIQDWIDEISKYTGTNICKLVLGNKADLEKERKVTREEISVSVILM
jgi:Ras-related protein Rab-1A